MGLPVEHEGKVEDAVEDWHGQISKTEVNLFKERWSYINDQSDMLLDQQGSSLKFFSEM